ncbi:MAG: hypothetical protein M3273_05085, partial [Actinomycetota bacterium]|nr:hypothetical protein [Actinomycetota bacterium]
MVTDVGDDSVVQIAAAEQRQPPDPAVVRTSLVQILKEHPEGLTIGDLTRELLEKTGKRFELRVDLDIDNLRTLGIVDFSSADERRYVVTDLADVFLRGADALRHG